VRHAEFEFCHITRGRVTIEAGNGRRWQFGPGDSLVIPAGFEGTWTVWESLSRLYVAYRPCDPRLCQSSAWLGTPCTNQGHSEAP